MSRYATSTDVTIDRSEAEIKRTLVRYGADDIVIGQSRGKRKAFVQFHYQERHIQAEIPLPDPREHSSTETGRSRKANVVRKAWDQACRQQWRILLLLIKAQLEAVENGLFTVDEAFLPWLLTSTGETIGTRVSVHVDKLLAGEPPDKLLPFGGKKK